MLKILINLLILLVISVTPSYAGPKVVVSIPPFQGLVTAVAGDLADVDVLIPGSTSAHGFTLKPSAMRDISRADMVVWVGPGFESSLKKPISQMAGVIPVLQLDEHPVMSVLQNRHLEHKEHDDHDGHDDSSIDPHIWLSPHNAYELLFVVANELSKLDPSNTDQYVHNAEIAASEIEKLTTSIQEQLQPFRQRKYIVYHDALQYFENSFGLSGGIAATLNPDQDKGVASITRLRERIKEEKITCLLSEPQFGDRMMTTLSEGLEITLAELNPVGSEDWFKLMQSVADTLVSCIGGE